MLTQFLTNPIITQIPPPLYEFREPLGHYYPILFPLVPTTLARASSVASFCPLVHTTWSKAGLGATDLPVQLTERLRASLPLSSACCIPRGASSNKCN